MPSTEGPLFVLGCPRSGTTLLQAMLHSHPRLAVAPETRFVLPAYARRLRFGDLREPANRRALGEFVAGTRYFANLGLERELVVRRVVEAPPTLGSALEAVFRAFAQRFGKERWGEKRPGYHRHVEEITRLFPDAHLLHVVRDPRDSTASLKRMPWWKRGTYHALAAWSQSVDFTDAASARWPVTRVRYEDLVADPEAQLARLCAAIGEEYDPATVRPEEQAPAVVPPKWWHRRARTTPSTDRIGRWRRSLEPWELALCESVLGERMERLGYERTGAAFPGVVHLARYEYVDRTRRLARRAELARDRWERRSEPNPVAALPADGGGRLSAGRTVRSSPAA